MRKFPLSFLLMMVTLLFGLRAQAADTVTIEWDIPGSVVISKSNAWQNPVAIPEGATSYTIAESGFFYASAAPGYELTATSIGTINNAPGAGGYNDPIRSVRFGITMGQFKNQTVKLTVVPEQLTPFSLDVANGASGIKFAYYNDRASVKDVSGVTDGTQTLEYPGSVNTLYVMKSDWKPLYSVKVDGVDVAPEGARNEYYVPLSENCQVYVAAEDPNTASTVDVTFKFTNNNPAIVSSLYDWTTRKFIYPSEFGAEGYTLTVPAGGEIGFNWNPEAVITGLKANDTDVAVTSGSTKVAVDADTEFVVTGKMTEYAEKTVQIYAVNPDKLHFTANGEPLVLTFVEDVPAGTLCGTYEIPVDAKLYEAKVLAKPNAGVLFDCDPGWYIKQAVRGTLAGNYSGADDRDLDGMVKIDLANCPLFIEAKEINYTNTLHIYYQGIEGGTPVLQSQFKGSNVPFKGDTKVKEGWSTITYDPEYNEEFVARINITENITEESKVVKTIALNGTPLKYDDNDLYHFEAPADNSVLKYFFSKVAPVPYYVTFNKSGSASASVKYDMGATLPDFEESTRFTAYGPTPVEIVPGFNVIVKLNDEVLTPVDGVISVTLTKEATFTFEQNAATQADLCTLKPASGAVVRKLKKISLDFPFDGEHSLDFNPEAAQAISITKKVEGAEAVHPEAIEPGEPSETSIPVDIFFPEITEGGDYTLSIPAAVFYQTAWDDAIEWFKFTDGCKVNAPISAEYKVDPLKPFELVFSPASGSENNDIMDYGTVITVSAPEAETLAVSESTLHGPWIVYNNETINKVEDAYEEEGWSWMESYKSNELRILINPACIKYAGSLSISADAGALVVDGSEEGPAFNYTAKFGEEKEFNVVSDPANGSTVDNFDVITLTYENASSIQFGKYFDMMLAKGISAGIWIPQDNVTLQGNKVIINVPADAVAEFPDGDYALSLEEGSLVIDDIYLSTPLHIGWTLSRNTSGGDDTQAWTPNPTGAIINYGYGIEAAIMFAENAYVTTGANFTDIEVYYDGEKVQPWNGQADGNGYRLGLSSDYPNALLISVYNDATADGTLRVVIPAGALKISGQPLEEGIDYTWNVYVMRDFAYTLDPAAGSTVKELSKVTLTFPDAETAELSEYFNTGRVALKKGYAIVSNAQEVTEVEGAEHPTFEITFATPALDEGTYTLNISYGSFILNTAFESPNITATFNVDPTATGVSGIFSEDGLYTVVNMQGVVLMKNADVRKVNTLSPGIYVINGRKVTVRK